MFGTPKKEDIEIWVLLWCFMWSWDAKTPSDDNSCKANGSCPVAMISWHPPKYAIQELQPLENERMSPWKGFLLKGKACLPSNMFSWWHLINFPVSDSLVRLWWSLPAINSSKGLLAKILLQSMGARNKILKITAKKNNYRKVQVQKNHLFVPFPKLLQPFLSKKMSKRNLCSNIQL